MLRWKRKRHHMDGISASIRELIFGLEDGIVSTGGAVIGIAAGTGDKKIVILSGIVIVIVEALSMAAGTYLSSKSKKQMLERKLKEEQEEIETLPEQEKDELRAMYRERGFEDEEIEILIRRITKNKDLWLEEMACKELGIGLAELEEPKGGAAVMWAAYTIGGFVPIVPFFLFDVNVAIAVAFVLGLIALFSLGWWKAHVTRTPALRGALEMMAIAASAGIIGFVLGKIIGSLTGIQA
ncbi:MAG: VIT1/CCC1 transporter family protein [Patescibacteria group bacterium]|nr:VIT1/CCC1 transporter family protein [Patescibacteria group bacterium]